MRRNVNRNVFNAGKCKRYTGITRSWNCKECFAHFVCSVYQRYGSQCVYQTMYDVLQVLVKLKYTRQCTDADTPLINYKYFINPFSGGT